MSRNYAVSWGSHPILKSNQDCEWAELHEGWLNLSQKDLLFLQRALISAYVPHFLRRHIACPWTVNHFFPPAWAQIFTPGSLLTCQWIVQEYIWQYMCLSVRSPQSLHISPLSHHKTWLHLNSIWLVTTLCNNMYLEGNKYPCFAQRPELKYREEGESGEKKIYQLLFGRGRDQPLQVHLCPCAHEQESGGLSLL